MIRRILIAIALAFATGTMAQTEPSLKPSTVAPFFSAADTLGVKHSLKDKEFKRRYVILDFWASWCGDCRREFAALKKLYAKYPNNKKRVWVSISFDHKADSWKQMLRKEKFPWLQISNGQPWKQNDIAKAYKLRWIPTFYVVSPNGKIVGSAITAEELEKVLEKI